jgi:hypothetical protein
MDPHVVILAFGAVRHFANNGKQAVFQEGTTCHLELIGREFLYSAEKPGLDC